MTDFNLTVEQTNPGEIRNQHSLQGVASALSRDGFLPVGRTSQRSMLSEKARRFHAKLAVLRKQPGNCGRCGKPNRNGHRQCDRCRAYARAYRIKKRTVLVTIDNALLTRLTARLASVEHELARMQVEARACYQRGYRTGARHERKVQYAELPEMSKQEAGQINHAYAEVVL